MSARKRQDLTGNKFGRLTVSGWELDDKGKTVQICTCECGTIIRTHTYRLKFGKLISCGCYARDLSRRRMTENAGAFARKHQASKSIPLKAGDICGRAKVIREVGLRFSGGNMRRSVLCECECGTEFVATVRDLVSGNTKSCGCLRGLGTRTTHGRTKSPEYHAWSAAKDRCYNTHSKDYSNYGGRGITMCDEWKNDFAAFFRDMGAKPSVDHSLDRSDVHEGYTSSNCVWGSKKDQVAHRRKLNIIQKIEREEIKISVATMNLKKLREKLKNA